MRAGCIILNSCFFIFLLADASLAQKKLPPETSEEIQRRLEEITANNDDETPDDDSYLQDLEYFSRHPINLNSADRETLQRLFILTPAQLDHFFSYRKIFGAFVNLYEIQAVPLWDVMTIRKLLPFITITSVESITSIRKRFAGGDRTLLLRYTRVLEKSAGYTKDTSGRRSYYPGSPDKIFLRYKYNFKNKLQYGFSAEKDAGEQFFKGSQKSGFDFYSAHLFVKDIGIIKSLVIGDFAVNFGQGLTQWQSLSFAGPGDAMFIKKQGEKLRPYTSAGEVLFNRGMGITLEKKRWQGTLFVSFRNMDATLQTDTIDFVSSIRLSGYHRTQSETTGKNILKQTGFGGNIQYSGDGYRIGINAIQYNFSDPILKGGQLYQEFIIPGKKSGNYSLDYSLTYKNLHFFGEAAIDNNIHYAFLNGIAISVNRYADFSMLHRSISRDYISLYGSAFTQSTTPVNENGFYTGINIKPNDVLRIDAYADIFSFPWLRYRVDAPSSGSEYMIQLNYRPNRNSEFYLRYRKTDKAINTIFPDLPLSYVGNKSRESFRVHATLKINRTYTFRTRAEVTRYDHKPGFLIYSDLLYKPMRKPFSGNFRLQYFETQDYDSRVYTFENDVLYSYSIPVFYGKGYRYYLNVRYNILRHLSLWTRIAQTRYLDRNTTGSGLDKIDGNTKTEFKCELVWQF
ncbi:MAG: hypothetical protein J0H55_08850 [Chitinophagaceae bacterium]|nr:hypothetical protein [Chitinophagaceae bacterium]